MIELALMYMEPCHRDEEAVLVLREVLAKEPENHLSRLWIAYMYVYTIMDLEFAFLREAVRISRDIIASGDESCRAAGYVVLYGALNNLTFGSKTHKEPSAEKIACLEHSVTLRPEWVYNRCFLAAEYQKAGRYPDALKHVEKARQNILPTSYDGDYVSRLFEVHITGRLSYKIDISTLRPMENEILKALALKPGS